VKVKRLIHIAEIVVINVRNKMIKMSLKLKLKDRALNIPFGCALSKQPKKPDRLLYFFIWLVDAIGMKPHHRTDHLASVSAGISVIADVADAVRSEHLFKDLQNPLSNKIRDPRKQAMSRYVIKLAKLVRGHFHDIHLAKLDVVQFEL
jgi:hypothetical protein